MRNFSKTFNDAFKIINVRKLNFASSAKDLKKMFKNATMSFRKMFKNALSKLNVHINAFI